MAIIVSFIEQNTLIEIVPEQSTHSRRIPGRQQIGPVVLRSDCIGLCLLVALPLIVPADRHRKGEPNDKAQQRQGGGGDKAETVTLTLLRVPLLAKRSADQLREPQDHERNRQDKERRIQYMVHML